MSTKLSLHRLMAGGEGFLRAIRVQDGDHQALRDARETIRNTLRHAFQNSHAFVTRSELYDSALAHTALAAVPPRLLTPKFRIQGSFAYFTANDCQNPPLQQIDQDDGIYLPISFVTIGGRARPTIASAAYFRIVERALQPLCAARGWTLNPRRPRNSCVRVELNSRLHIDLPLYAIRDAAFEQLVEVAADASLQKAAQLRDARDLDERIYRELADAEIILAHRADGWIKSDPRRLEDWFRNAINLYGEPVRDLSRCFKGLRDAKFNDGLSSICIMACVVRAIENVGGVDDKRLDLAIVAVAREIARMVTDPVENPVFPGEPTKCFCVEWDADYRTRVRTLFADTADQLEEAIDDTFHKGVALERARRAFGQRVPNDEGLIALLTPAQVVREAPAQRQPAAVVPRTKSG